MAQKFVGVDLGSHHVKVAVVSSGFRGVQLLDAFEEPVGHVPTDDEEDVDPLGVILSAALNVLRERRLLSETMGIVLPPGLVSYRVLSFPFSDERRITQAVAFEAEGQFPVPLEELSHGHIVVPAQDGGRALIGAVREERVSQIAGIFTRAGADLKHVTSGALAAAHVAEHAVPAATPEMLEKGLQPVSLVVDIGHQATTLTALGAKGPMAVRTHRRGGRHITNAVAAAYHLDADAAEAAKHRDGFVPHRGLSSLTPEQLEAGRVVATALEPIVREIAHTRLWLRSTYNLEVGQLLLAGGGARLRGLDAYLAEQLEIPTGLLAPKTTLVKGLEGRDCATLLPAIGAAYGAARRPLMQLHAAGVTEADGSWVAERMMSLVAIGVAVLAFGALDTIAQVKAIEAEKAAWEAELEKATTDTFGRPLAAAEVGDTLAAVEGADLMSKIPKQGALEVLAHISEAAKPFDYAPPQPAAAPAPGFAPGAIPGLPGAGGDEDEEDDEGSSAGAAPVADAGGADVVAPDKGVGMADSLTILKIDLRERKVEINATAKFSSSQDRFASELKKKSSCIQKVNKGKVSDRNDLKVFDMTVDHECYKGEPEQTEEDDAEADDGKDAKDDEGGDK